jgi:hypothetical protein
VFSTPGDEWGGACGSDNNDVNALKASTGIFERRGINDPVRHSGRGPQPQEVMPLHTEAPNIVDAERFFTRVPALHVGPMELSPVV